MSTEPRLITLADANATDALGHKLATVLEAPLVIYLRGPLGAGKSALVRACLRALGVEGAIKSPTFSIVEPYQLGDRHYFHFDLYRIGSPDECDFMGMRDYFRDESVCFIEWPERGKGAIAPADVTIELSIHGTGRTAAITAHRPRAEQLLLRWLA